MGKRWRQDRSKSEKPTWATLGPPEPDVASATTTLELLGRVISFSSPAGHGLYDGMRGTRGREGIPSYDIAFDAGTEIREALEWYQLFKLDQENPEPT